MSETTSNHPTVRIGQVLPLLKIACASGQTPFLLGSPGIGKTMLSEQYAKLISADCVTIIAATRDRLDIMGLPHNSEDGRLGKVTSYAPDAFFASLSKERNPDGSPVVVLWDELNAAPETVMPVLYRIFQERVAGDMTLRDNVHMIAAGNPASAMSAGRDMHPVLRRRFFWIKVESTIPDWTDSALKRGIDGRVIAFLNNPSFADKFNTFNPKDRDALTYATPDSWTKLARGLDDVLAALAGADNDMLRLTAFAGWVGSTAAASFSGFLELMDSIVDPHTFLKAVKRSPIPENQDAVWLLMGGCLRLVQDSPRKHGQAVLVLCRRLARERDGMLADFGAFLSRGMFESIKNDQGDKTWLMKTPEFQELVEEFSVGKNDKLIEALTLPA